MQISNCTLAIIDVQGKLAERVYESQSIIANIQRLVHCFKVLEIPILWTEQAPGKIGKTVESIAGLLIESIQPIHKFTFSCYAEPQFKSRIDALARKQVVLTGIEAHICVYQTARDLKLAGYEVFVCADAVSSQELADRDIALQRMAQEGIVLTSVEMVICELLRTSFHRHFKEVMFYLKS